MGRWLTLLGLLFPLGAQAAPVGPTLAPPSMQTYYDIQAPAPVGAAPNGWGFHATLQGRTMNLAARDQGWAPDPLAQPGDMAAGFGWRGRSASAMLGYSQYEIGPHYDPRARPREDFANQGQPAHTGVLGLSFVLHAP